MRLVQDEKYYYLPKLRNEFPPFIYKCEYFGERDERRTGFLNLTRIPKAWTYSLCLSNLTKLKISNIEISVRYSGEAEWLALMPGITILKPEQTVEEGKTTYTIVKGTNDWFSASLESIESGRVSVWFLSIVSDKRPFLKQLEFDIQCQEGTFEKLTSTQWEQVGWSKTNYKKDDIKESNE
jgi:hypothetical protein